MEAFQECAVLVAVTSVTQITALHYNLSTALFDACTEEKYRILGIGFVLMIYYSRYLKTIIRDRFYNLFIRKQRLQF